MKRAPIIPLWQIAMAERATTTRHELYVALAARDHGPKAIANACGVTARAVTSMLAYEPGVSSVLRRERAQARAMAGQTRDSRIALALRAARATVAAMRGAA